MSKGFTLIELLVVIAIIAILSVVVILTLNPAELLRQSRDSNRVSDFSVMKSAIGLFEADVATSSPNALGVYGNLYGTSGINIATTSTFIGPGGWGFATSSASTIATSSLRGINGSSSGWIPINFSFISSGAPIGSEPVDPLNSCTPSSTGCYAYVFAASGTTYKLATHMESQKYGYNGTNNIVSTDGGNSTNTYESGTSLVL